jgi:hypothetical protein
VTAKIFIFRVMKNEARILSKRVKKETKKKKREDIGNTTLQYVTSGKNNNLNPLYASCCVKLLPLHAVLTHVILPQIFVPLSLLCFSLQLLK